ncbi:DUF397 domain-containing protein [Streptomyces sp. NPDC047880]|uniref:DUF397 domain-containing protein n=1 Tax=Streptomyces TaxID=1883 RepID=UPI0013BFCC05|nr:MULTISPECIES: DUF397 domain-containing protein [Streptomyces]NEB62633.1 DUF397 domain-containing protein [Streptomyces diastaticus]NEC26428.1 DUF397 domain-containing protein [Streptomyces sp. SID8111]NED00982.1 DUF397 domain-containing protein [Streptomyces sp. SID6648]WUB58778.1 DUF397 domain-containing protein [Streptomyces griseorubiginosus]
MTTTPDLTNARWRKALRSESAQGCVEVAFLSGDLVAVRDSKNPLKTAHVYPVAAWTVFQDHLRGLVPAEDSRIVVTITDDAVLLSDRQDQAPEHVYTHREWLFFLDGVLKREPQLCAAAA